ncbi:MAG: serine/threonine protein kinase [Gemmataceae bacterium]|nr:serine/threonine protein kinase [Gemmataceae bacterium]
MPPPERFPPSSRRSSSQAAHASAGRIQPPPKIPGYDNLVEVGRGAMGIVYKARHLALGRTVALKTIRAGAEVAGGIAARFKAEARAVARLRHRNIIQIFDVGEHEGMHYLALEFVEGQSLAQHLSGKPLTPSQAAELIESLARAMQHAHELEVIHRDLKPGNILMATSSLPPPLPGEPPPPVTELVPKITDFGLAKRLDANEGLTRHGDVLGTPAYMAPEQALGLANEAGPEADIYSLGAILYECLTGRPPFKGSTFLQTLEQVRTQDALPPSRYQSAVPPQLDAICLRCLRKNPVERYASMRELADALRAFLAGKSREVPKLPAATTPGDWGVLGWVIGAGLALAAGVLAWFLLRR